MQDASKNSLGIITYLLLFVFILSVLSTVLLSPETITVFEGMTSFWGVVKGLFSLIVLILMSFADAISQYGLQTSLIFMSVAIVALGIHTLEIKNEKGFLDKDFDGIKLEEIEDKRYFWDMKGLNKTTDEEKKEMQENPVTVAYLYKHILCEKVHIYNTFLDTDVRKYSVKAELPEVKELVDSINQSYKHLKKLHINSPEFNTLCFYPILSGQKQDKINYDISKLFDADIDLTTGFTEGKKDSHLLKEIKKLENHKSLFAKIITL